VAFALLTIEETEHRQRIESELALIDPSDGINQHEANAISSEYFGGYISACGGPDEGQLVNGEWIVPARIGYAGSLGESPIRIDAKTGGVSYRDGPSFSSFARFRFALEWGIPIRTLTQFFLDRAL
jgi:hypothetical protein